MPNLTLLVRLILLGIGLVLLPLLLLPILTTHTTHIHARKPLSAYISQLKHLLEQAVHSGRVVHE